jgi:hypothetical protein
MNTYYVVIEILAGEYALSTSSLVTADSEDEAKRIALLDECHYDEEDLEWSKRGIYDCGGQFHYAVHSCTQVAAEDVAVMEKYMWGRKSDAQVIIDTLAKAHAELEKLQDGIPLNFDGVLGAMWHVMGMLKGKEVKPVERHTIVMTTKQLEEAILACELSRWEGDNFASTAQILMNALKGEQV